MIKSRFVQENAFECGRFERDVTDSSNLLVLRRIDEIDYDEQPVCVAPRVVLCLEVLVPDDLLKSIWTDESRALYLNHLPVGGEGQGLIDPGLERPSFAPVPVSAERLKPFRFFWLAVRELWVGLVGILQFVSVHVDGFDFRNMTEQVSSDRTIKRGVDMTRNAR